MDAASPPEVLAKLFDIATARLRERGIGLTFDEQSVACLLGQKRWRKSLNPLHALEGEWHRKVASPIERLLIDRRAKAGDTVRVTTDDYSTLQVTVDSPPV